MGNILRHGYHRIDDKVMWDTVKNELPPVKAAVLRALKQPLRCGPLEQEISASARPPKALAFTLGWRRKCFHLGGASPLADCSCREVQ